MRSLEDDIEQELRDEWEITTGSEEDIRVFRAKTEMYKASTLGAIYDALSDIHDTLKQIALSLPGE